MAPETPIHPIAKSPSIGGITATFLYLGVTAYGGLAMVEPIRRRIVQEKGWLSQKEFLDGLALCQLVPGATVVQLATYVGFRLRRTAGALAAAGAFILPAFLLILGLSFLYGRYGDLSEITLPGLLDGYRQVDAVARQNVIVKCFLDSLFK